MRKPEMVLVTRNLAELPKDLAAAPALRGLVDEALVFHYEEDEARLSLEGSLRRLAYEHDLELQDRFLATLLAAPAEIGLWRSGKGRAEYFVASVERGALAKLTELLAKISLDDGQLKQVGSFSVGGESLTLYAFDYGGGRSLGFLASGERWIILSDPSLALDDENELTEDAQEILGELLRDRHPWQAQLPHSSTAKHSLVVGAQALTLGYAHFLPALSALRLDFDSSTWQAALRIDGKALPEGYALGAKLTSLWRAVPANAALCAAVPVDWKRAEAPVDDVLQGEKIGSLLAALDPLAAVCWYPGSRFSAPLFVALAARPLPADTPRVLKTLAEQAWTRQGGAQGKGKDARYVATVPSVHGLRDAGDSERAFRPAIAHRDRLIVFSPDRRHVDAALAVAAKQAPAAGDSPGLQGPAWLFVDPRRLAQLTRAEVQEVLPADDESYFREIARARLWPRLEAWGQNQAPLVVVPAAAAENGFVALHATGLAARPAAAR